MMGRLFKYFSITILITVMVAAVFVLLAPNLGWRIDASLSNSMDSTFRAGDLVVTQPTSPADIEVGDIITYISPLDGKVIAHRVVTVQEQSPVMFITKGDANEDPDPYLVPTQNVFGRESLHVPFLGYVSQFVKSPLGLLLMIVIPGLIVIAMEIRNIWIELNKERTLGVD